MCGGWGREQRCILYHFLRVKEVMQSAELSLKRNQTINDVYIVVVVCVSSSGGGGGGSVCVRVFARVCVCILYVCARACVFVIIILWLYKFSTQGRRRMRDNGVGPGWTDDECVHFMTTKA